ncbi:metal cation symporter ZIP14-like [Mya arenaria]|uniref:metal cation symporter ZIP14-like n=1 Tax=Mya arenaria TaxID=6604 RepID=UPI0022E19C0F|nr:metal cation symporter ZIP14-like [Mya arenaria]
MAMKGCYVMFALCAVLVQVKSVQYDLDVVRSAFLSNIQSMLGSGGEITLTDLQTFFSKHQIQLVNSTVSECFMQSNGTNPELNEKCLLEKCLSPTDVYELSGLGRGQSKAELSTLTTVLLNLLEQGDCVLHHTPQHHPLTSSVEAWGYGILCTTLINVCSLGGLIALPFIHGDLYKKVLLFMVALAVGTLAGSSLLFLIPEALELTEQELDEHSYVWKCTVVIFGILAFFNIERLLKMITEYREKKSDPPGRPRTTSTSMDFSSFHQTRPQPEYKNVEGLPKISPCGNSDTSSDSLADADKDENNVSEDRKYETEFRSNGESGQLVPHHHHHHHPRKPVAPVAWMIIFGDGIHNFIDGVSIGAAFTESILAGVSVSVAILCEELPHELGDFAVLLNAGMRLKKAVLYNFLSACMCYLGLIVGIFLGENMAAHTWVFAFAGGMFLYISLVDMMPEMNSAGELEDNKHMSHLTIFLLQNIGMITGFSIMLLMAIYGGNIESAIKGHS